LYIDNLKIIF